MLDYSNEIKENTQIHIESSSDSDDDLPLNNFVRGKTTVHRIHYKDVYSDDEAGPSSRISEQDIVSSNIVEGTYVLVEYKTKLSSYRYAAVVQSVIDYDEVEVMFLKVCKFQNSQTFKANDNDKSFVNYDQILKILSAPHIFTDKNRLYYKFNEDVDVFEKV
nr:unnamed protein product [Callosobruchus chinensis]